MEYTPIGEDGDGTSRAPSSKHRQLVLVVVCLMTVGSHFGKHFISSLGPALIDRMSMSRSQFGFLFSIQEIPGIFLPVSGGIIISALRLPFGAAAVCLAAIVLLGQAVTAAAVHVVSYRALVLGRLFFGLGDGMLVVVQGSLVGLWFREGFVSSAFGMTLFCSRLSSFAGLAAPAFLSDSVGLVPAMYCSSAVCLASMVAALLYWMYLEDELPGVPLPGSTGVSALFSLPRDVWRTILQLDTNFFSIAAIWAVLATATFTMLHFSADIAKSSPLLSLYANLSGIATGGILLLSGLSSPATGLLQDRIGRRVELLAGALACSAVGLLIGAYGIYSSLALTVFGLSLVACGFVAAPVTLLSSLALVVQSGNLPAALGVYKASENAVLSLGHFTFGALRDSTGSYTLPLLLLSAVAASGIVAAFVLRNGSESKRLSTPKR